jgi:hypothetical protein
MGITVILVTNDFESLNWSWLVNVNVWFLFQQRMNSAQAIHKFMPSVVPNPDELLSLTTGDAWLRWWKPEETLLKIHCPLPS